MGQALALRVVRAAREVAQAQAAQQVLAVLVLVDRATLVVQVLLVLKAEAVEALVP